MTELNQIRWVKAHLSDAINAAIVGSFITTDWLAAICVRETGIIIAKQTDVPKWDAFIGDNSHGYSPWQIDIRSFPDFVNSGEWKDPFKAAAKAVSILKGKKAYILSKVQLQQPMLDRAICAAYNCGEGRIVQILAAKQDIDYATANHNYSREVWRLRELYKSL